MNTIIDPNYKEQATHYSNKSQSGTRNGQWVRAGVYAGIVVIISLLPLVLNSPYHLHICIMTFIYIIAAVSLRTITISGQFPLAHAGFMGIGAYVAGIISRSLGWPPWFTMPAGAVAAAVIGLIIGYPFSRLRTLYYAMGSLFFGIGILYFIYAFADYTGGYTGLLGIHPIFTSGSKVAYYYLFLALVLMSIIVLYRLEFSRIGVNLKAIAQSHLVASSVGINEASYRIMVVGVGCFFAGLAGACYAHYNLAICAESFNLMATLWFVMYVLIGGINSFSGPIIGTIIGFVVPECFRGIKVYAPLIFAIILLIILYAMPKGMELVNLPRAVRSWYQDRRKQRGVVDAAGN